MWRQGPGGGENSNDWNRTKKWYVENTCTRLGVPVCTLFN